MSPERLELTVLGQTLTLRSEADPKYLRTLVAFLEERVSAMQSSGVRDPMKALILAALEITDELHRARDDQSRDSTDVQARLSALVEILDRLAPESRDRPTERR
jgi:cell division protein ZapA